PTRDNIPVNGIALDKLLAVSEHPLRILEPQEAAAARAKNPDPICAVSGQSANINHDQVVAESGGKILYLCGHIHATQLNSQLTASESGGSGQVAADGPVEPSTWTEGQKKVILIRVDFPDLAGDPFADATGILLISNLNVFYTEMSYGRAGFAAYGAGSDMTPTFRMPQPAAYYGTNNFYDQLRADARSAATTAGYTMANFDRDVICMGSVPGFGWAGLAYVGAAGAWLRSAFTTGVAGHELGHNWGLNHANYWDTTGQSVIGPGTSIEYGDTFDTMGSANAGNNHFNARYKSYLNWLTATETLTVTSNGTYRIYAHDNPASTGLRGLRVVKNSGTNYWIEFRQKFTGVKWLMNGAGLRWTGNGNERSQLLDTTPGSTDGKNDAAIVIGRTFSDRVTGIHITPVGKGGTSPESLDVVVNIGLFPADQPPVVNVSPSALTAATGAALTFTATASDPDGDSLAYYWDFGDGNFGTNGPVATKSWASAGEYVVRCVVTDMKGGEASKSLVVTIGSPTTYRINGYVGTGSAPVQNVRVYVSTTRMAWTDSDGTYTIVGLPAGTYTVNAILENYTITGGFTNPVVVGPNATGIDFVASQTSFAAPAITTQPASQTVNPGTSAAFSVAATGTAPLRYQWRFNGGNIAGATASSYTKANAQASDAGNYSVVITNVAGTITSGNAVLSVNSPPGITTPPQPQTVIAGNSANFTVTASGTAPLGYQWRLNGTNIAGATTTALSRPNVQLVDAGNYAVVVTNSLGSITSAPAALTVNFTLTVSATYGGTVTKSPDLPAYAANTV
ncbi:MAG TPA: immunoglobulin domain-containing protein, partial [Methylomirabilota bacterium]|nr:immunoglobulin domain-containing protein [Methylomirabilota bacterium]